MTRSALNFWVGLFVIGGFVALLLLALKIGNLGAEGVSNPYRLKAYFSDIGGLKEKAPVRSAGVLVGRVAAIRFDDKRYNAEVTFEMDRRFNFPADTTAMILTSGILGESYVGLAGGKAEAMLKDGASLTQTQSAVALEQVISQLLPGKGPAPLDPYRVTANFTHIGGLKEGAPVRSAGVQVGQVTQIRFDNSLFEAEVKLAIDKRFQFPKDTSASILSSGLVLGESYIGLDGGGDDAMLKDGDKLALTQSAVVLEKVIGQFLFSKAQEGAPKNPE